jgi:hypothetical protein
MDINQEFVYGNYNESTGYLEFNHPNGNIYYLQPLCIKDEIHYLDRTRKFYDSEGEISKQYYVDERYFLRIIATQQILGHFKVDGIDQTYKKKDYEKKKKNKQNKKNKNK